MIYRAYKSIQIITLLLLLVAAVGCSDGSGTDSLFGSDGNGDGHIAKNLDIAITSPSTAGTPTGWSKKLSGTCGTAAVPVYITGGATGFAICQGDQTWEVTVDTSAAAVGALTVYAQMIDSDGVVGNRVSLDLNKFSSECDDPAVRATTFGNTTTTNVEPWVVCTATQLANVNTVLTDDVELHNDIDIGGGSFSPIGTYYENATFEGNNFTIFDFNIIQAGNVYGIFRRFRNTTTVQNLNIVNGSVRGDYYMGGLVGYINNGGTVTIDNVNVTDLELRTNHATNGHSGAIFGGVQGNVTLIVQNSTVTNPDITGRRYMGGVGGYIDPGTGSVTFTDVNVVGGTVDGMDYSGGVVGRMRESNATYTRVSNGADVSGTGAYIGGIIGYPEGGDFTDVFNTGDISSAGSYVGGLFGYHTQAGFSISGTSSAATRAGAPTSDPPTTNACYNTGDVSGASYVGGIGGRINANTLSSCYNTGDITGSSNYVGGIIGQHTGDDVDDVFSTGVILGGDQQIGGIVGSMTNASQRLFDCYNTGAVTGVSIAPNYIGGIAGVFDGTILFDGCYNTGAVQANGTLTDLGGWDASTNTPAIADGVGNNLDYYTVTVAGATTIDGLTGWTVGQYIEFDGTVWRRNSTLSYVGGLAGRCNSAAATLSNSYNTGAVTMSTPKSNLNSHERVGGLVGSSNCNIDTTYSTGVVSADLSRYNGGLIGYKTSGGTFLNNSYATGSVTGLHSSGGLVGVNNASMNNNYATGDVTTTGNSVGGLIGNNTNNSILNSYAEGNVIGVDNIGGLIGYTTGDVVDTCYATGDVTGSRYDIGGLIGEATNATQRVDNSYATGNVVANHVAPQRVGGFMGYARGTVQYDNNYSTGNVSVLSGDDSAIIYYVGGHFGIQDRDNIPVSNSYATGNVTVTIGANVSQHRYAGGFAGLSYGDHTDTYATGDVAAPNVRYVGGHTGYINAGDWVRGYATGTVSGRDYVGGMIGSVNNAASTVDQSYALGNVTANGVNGDYTGGLLGYNRGDITNSYAIGDVTGVRHYVGGLEGGNTSNDNRIIRNNFATGDVTHTDLTGIRLGGLTGYIRTTTNNYTDNFSTGNVSCGGGECGGLIGYLNRNAVDTLRRNYVIGTVSRLAGGAGADIRFGPIVGRTNSATGIENGTNFYNSDFPVLDELGVAMGGTEYLTNQTGLTSAQMTVQGNFNTFDFGTPVWEMPTGAYVLPGTVGIYTYPILEWME